MIKLENLTPRQVAFCELMWALQTTEEVDAFIQSLPKDFQEEANSIKFMLQLAVVDDMLDGDPDLTEAKEIINRF